MKRELGDEARKHFDGGVRLYRLGKHKEAVSSFDKALKGDPRNPKILHQKAIAYSSMGEHEKALACCNTALEHVKPHKRDPYILSRKAIELSHLGRRNEALDCHMAALKKKKDDPLIMYNLAVDLSALGRHREALKYSKRALGRAPKDPDILNRAALASYHLGKYNDAKRYHNRALKQRPRDPLILLNLAVDMSAMDKHDKALEYSKNAAKLAPKNRDIKARIISELSHLSRHRDALRYCNKALKQEPDDPDILNLKAVELHRMGRDDEAIKCLDRALRIRPRDPGLLYNKAIDLIALGLHKRAVDCCDEALKNKAGDPEILSSKAFALSELRQYEKAIDCCDEALRNMTDKTPKSIADRNWIRDLKASIDFKTGIRRRTTNEIDDDESKIILPDTNIWLSYYGFDDDKQGMKKQEKIREYIDRAIEYDQVSILKIVECEVYGKIGQFIAGIITRRMKSSKKNNELVKSFEDVRVKFSDKCSRLGLSHDDSTGDWKKASQAVSDMFEEIWKDPHPDAKLARDSWAIKQAGYIKKNFKIVKTIKQLINEGPRQNVVDEAILIAAALLADMRQEKNIILVTGDRDFILFRKWIQRILHVEVLDSKEI